MIDALNSAISYPKDVSTVDMDYLLSMLADPNSPSSTTFSFGTQRLYFPSRTDVEDTNSLLAGMKEKRGRPIVTALLEHSHLLKGSKNLFYI